MPKPYTFPTLFDEVLQISMTKLKEWEYLNPEQIKSGTLTWSRNGNTTGSISIMVNTYSDQQYIELDYKYKDEPRKYKVQLVSISSNLGKGVIWYFLCPVTNKRCRKLYSIGGYFLHREAFIGCLYESQIHSKKYRRMDKTIGLYFKIESLLEQLNSKHMKKHYSGRPTKKFIKIQSQINNYLSNNELKDPIA